MEGRFEGVGGGGDVEGELGLRLSAVRLDRLVFLREDYDVFCDYLVLISFVIIIAIIIDYSSEYK